MTDRFERIILDAIADVKNQKDVRIESDEISTMLMGTPENIFHLVETCFFKAAKKAEHVVLTITFSRGCPGEPDEPCCSPQQTKEISPEPEKKIVKKKNSGITVAAQFALYPMNDTKYMDRIYREIEQAKQYVKVTPKHYCTRLDGDISQVFAALENAFDNTGIHTPHVVMTATISKKGAIEK